jgi:hypothetical protein
MSYHEIHVERKFRVFCPFISRSGCACTWEGGLVETAGKAEELAAAHIQASGKFGEIEADDSSGYCRNYDHLVQIEEVTLVGRQF